jgi:hypothetical protein
MQLTVYTKNTETKTESNQILRSWRNIIIILRSACPILEKTETLSRKYLLVLTACNKGLQGNTQVD